MATESVFTRVRPALPAVLLCLGLNALLFAGVALRRPDYLADAKLNPNPDARDYVLLGRNLFEHGVWSRSAEAPFVPDVLRTPGYPPLAGLLDLLGGAALIYLVQALLHCGSCVLLYRLISVSFGTKAGVIASLLMATDLVLVEANVEAMAEPLFLFLLLAAAVCLIPPPERGGLVRCLAGGTLLAAAILVRPAALYLPLVLAAVFLAGGLLRGRLTTAVLQIVGFTLPVALAVGAWVGRNHAVFGLTKLTTVGTHNLIYFVGAGAYQVHFGLELPEAQKRLAADFDLPAYAAVQNPHLSGLDPRETERKLAAAADAALSRYPADLALASLLAVPKALVSHGAQALGEVLGWDWVAPGIGGLLRGDAEAYRRLFGNPPVLLIAFFWQMLHTGLVLALTPVGVWRSLRSPASRAAAILLLAVLTYFVVTIPLFGFEAFYRSRVPALPLLFAFAAAGLVGTDVKRQA